MFNITKKDYKLIAEVIKYEGRELNSLSYITGLNFTEARDAVGRITLSLAIIFADKDSQFDKQIFMDACKGD